MEGFKKATVRFAPAAAWTQRSVWVHPTTSSDDLKWWLAPWTGAHCSTVRLVGGSTGIPWGRCDYVAENPPQSTAQEKEIVIVTPSFS